LAVFRITRGAAAMTKVFGPCTLAASVTPRERRGEEVRRRLSIGGDSSKRDCIACARTHRNPRANPDSGKKMPFLRTNAAIGSGGGMIAWITVRDRRDPIAGVAGSALVVLTSFLLTTPPRL
jgi:hypothetical protein